MLSGQHLASSTCVAALWWWSTIHTARRVLHSVATALGFNWRLMSSCARLSSVLVLGGSAWAKRDKKLYEKPLINLSCSRQVSISSLIRVSTAWNWHFQPIAEAPDQSDSRHGCRNLYFRRVLRSFVSSLSRRVGVWWIVAKGTLGNRSWWRLNGWVCTFLV